jgi:predicted RNA polymerase sigma factor
MEAHGAELDELTEEEKADLEEALAEAEREEPVPDEEVRALFACYRRP